MICGKNGFKTREEAMQAILGMMGDNRSQRANLQPTKTYFCKDCSTWHLFTEGKRKKKKRSGNDKGHEIGTIQKQWHNHELIIHDARKFVVK